MKQLNSILTAATLLLFVSATSPAQPARFRSGVFLHHSTGGLIWNQSSATSVPREITAYNAAHSLSGTDSVTLQQQAWPGTPGDNEWSTWHEIFENSNPAYDDIGPIIQNNKIVIIKSCFPSSNISGVGGPSDTLSPTTKTVYNYKWHWRTIIRLMSQHPENFFVIWTNAPLVPNQTTDTEALLADGFCYWAKDTLAQDLDSEFGNFPANVYVFDFFHKLAGPDGKLPLQYAYASDNSHPNGAATDLVAPQFVNEVFDATLNYESVTSVPSIHNAKPEGYQLLQNYPNPFNPMTVIKFSVGKYSNTSLRVFDILGQEVATLMNEAKPAGSYTVSWDATALPSGIYFYRLTTDHFTNVKKMLLIK